MNKTEMKEELVELSTIQIAIDDKIHRIFADLQKMRNLHKHVDERLGRIKNELGKLKLD